PIRRRGARARADAVPAAAAGPARMAWRTGRGATRAGASRAGGRPAAARWRPGAGHDTAAGPGSGRALAPGSRACGHPARQLGQCRHVRRGAIVQAPSPALVVPAASLVVRDGRSLVFVLQSAGPRSTVGVREVRTGRRLGTEVEIVEGLAAGARLVASG